MKNGVFSTFRKGNNFKWTLIVLKNIINIRSDKTNSKMCIDNLPKQVLKNNILNVIVN